MLRYTLFCLIILLCGTLYAEPVRYNFCPKLGYCMKPVVKVVKAVVKPVVKVVKAKPIRRLIGYKKVCGPNGCSMEPQYEVIKDLDVTKKVVTTNKVQTQSSCSSGNCSSRPRLFRRLFRR